MKILHVLTDTNIGGAGKCVLGLADWANANDTWRGSLEVVLPLGAALKPEFEKRGIPVTEASYVNDASFHRKAVKHLYKIFCDKKPDIVHTHAALSGRVAAKLYGRCKIVSTRHSVFDVTDQEAGFPRKQISGFMNRVLSDAIIAVSPAALENLTAIGVDPAIVHVIPNGVRAVDALPMEQKTKIRTAYGLRGSEFIVSMIARLEDVKGHDTVLDAAKILANLDSDIVFLLAGTGAAEGHIRARIRDEGIGNVRMLGFVQAIHELENITDLQLNASFGTEATSLALLEGMSLGIPAVVSDFGGNPYVIQNTVNGLLFPLRNSNALARALLTLRRDAPTRRAMGIRAKEIYQEKFTLDSMGINTFNLYKSLGGLKI